MKSRSLLLLFLFSLNLYSAPKKPVSTSSKITVYIFLSETCPICQSYTLTLKSLCAKYKEAAFIGVFPNYYSDEKSIAAFKKEYAIPFELIGDKDGILRESLRASITPEVFVLDDQKTILYSGRIDDSFYAVGKRRKVINSSDLNIALESIFAGKKVVSPRTQAVGCIISSSK